MAEVAAQRVAEDHDAVVGVVAGRAVALVEAVGARRRPPSEITTATCASALRSRSGRSSSASRTSSSKSLVVERVELHELAFFGRHRQAFARERARSGARSLRTRSRTPGRASRPGAPPRTPRRPSAPPPRSRPARRPRAPGPTPIELKPCPTTSTTRPTDIAISAATPTRRRERGSPGALGARIAASRMVEVAGPISACGRSRDAGSRSCPRRSG